VRGSLLALGVKASGKPVSLHPPKPHSTLEVSAIHSKEKKMTPSTSIFRRMAFARLASYLISACVLGSVMIASGQEQAVRAPARPGAEQRSQIRTEGGSAITLDPPTGWDFQEHAFDARGNALPEAPANFRRLGEAKPGEAGSVHTLTLRFKETATLTHIQSTQDFPIEHGGSCVEAVRMPQTRPARCWCALRPKARETGLAIW
jgi:hypothetical protein